MTSVEGYDAPHLRAGPHIDADRPVSRLLEQVRIVNRREGGLIEAYVPLELISTEDVPVDRNHVNKLADSIKEQEAKHGLLTGQISPTLLADIPSLNHFPTIDGFHRAEALRLLGKKEAYATIRENSTMEDVIDLRILSATSHRAIRFARVVEWMKEAWELSPWKDRISVSQAYTLRLSRRSTGKNLGLSPDEAAEIMKWVDTKNEAWGISVGHAKKFIYISDTVDPELVKNARERKSGHNLESLTPDHLSAIARMIPNRHALQRQIAAVVIDQKLTVSLTASLADAARGVKTKEEFNDLVHSDFWTNPNWKVSKPSLEPTAEPSETLKTATRYKDHIYALQKLGFAKSPEEAIGIIQSALDTFKGIPSHKKVQNGMLYSAGEALRTVYIVQEGHTITYQKTDDGRRVVTSFTNGEVVLPSDFLSGSGEYIDYAQAVSDCTVQPIPFDVLKKGLEKNPNLPTFLLVSQAIQALDLKERLTSFGTKTAPQRIKGALLEVTNKAKTLPKDQITQDFVGELAASTRQTTNAVIIDLEKRGLIYWARGLGPQLVDKKALIQEYDTDTN